MRQMQSPVHYRLPSPLRAPFCVCLLAFEYPSAKTVNTILASGAVILHTHSSAGPFGSCGNLRFVC